MHRKKNKSIAFRALPAALLLALLLPLWAGGCTPAPKRYEVTYLSLFDTVVTLIAYAESEAEAEEMFRAVYDDLARYDALFDIYEERPGLNNLKTVNDNAGAAPVKVEPELLALLKFGREAYALTEGRVNIAFGSVLSIWHDARTAGIAAPETASLPDMAALRAAAGHANIEDMILDEGESTVYFADPALRLDVGAVAKGYAAELAAENARARGVGSMLINLGGNVCAIGTRGDGKPWRVEVQDPDDPSAAIGTVELQDASMVTSGGYQRYYTVDGVNYHHIIDPDTLMPARHIKAVTVIHEDSALADAFSTALFNLPYEEGRALAEEEGVSAVWELTDGSIHWLTLDPAA